MTESTSTPYNIREKQEKNAAYRSLIRAELADELYEKILSIIVDTFIVETCYTKNMLW